MSLYTTTYVSQISNAFIANIKHRLTNAVTMETLLHLIDLSCEN